MPTWDAICDTAIRQALEGDARAREWISSYLVGRPLAAVDKYRSGAPLSLNLFLLAVNQAVPDPEVRDRISQVLDQLCDQEGQKALDGPDVARN
jgi:hypothetical protein